MNLEKQTYKSLDKMWIEGQWEDAGGEVFANKNPQSTLKLAQARGCVLATCGAAGLSVNEHAARLVKKAVVGTGAAEKAQVQAMLKVLLPGAKIAGTDAADALAVAIADAHLAPAVGSATGSR